jgi:hypothetical protein
MKTTPVLLLVLAVPALADGPPPPSWDIERIHDFAALTLSEVSRLDGRRALFCIRLNSEADSEAGRIICDCLGKDGIERTVWFCDGQQVVDDQEDMIVEATLRLVYLKPWTTPDGMRFEAYTEYRLEDARRCSIQR